jgi:hypothetical protein
MIVACCSIRFHLHGNRTLKEKRRIANAIRDRLKNKFNISIAEVADQDLWQSLHLGFAAVGSDSRYLEGLMEQLLRAIEGMNLAEVVDHEVRLVRLTDSDRETKLS